MHKTSIPLYWRNIEKRNKLVGRMGKIISYTYVCDTPENFKEPYILALIELEDGARVLGQIVDNEVSIGSKVKAIIRRIKTDGKRGLIHYGIKFKVI